MARGDKNYDKVTHGLVKGKGKGSKEKKAAIHKMIEALIADKTEEAQTHLHAYLKLKTRDILVGEAEDADDKEIEKGEEEAEKDDKEEKNDEADSAKEKADEEEDKEGKEVKDKEKVDEDFAKFGHGEGAMSRKVQGKLNYKGGKKGSKALKHGNHAPELSDKIEGDIKFDTNGTSKALKHGNNAPGLEDKVKGNVFKK